MWQSWRLHWGSHDRILDVYKRQIWECLVKPGKKARPGAVIDFGEGLLTGEIIDVVDEGNRLIQFHYEGIFEEILDQLGEMPLPPYITHKMCIRDRGYPEKKERPVCRDRCDHR